jgi:cyclopropane-fatty-acyl-phospholipid synthase
MDLLKMTIRTLLKPYSGSGFDVQYWDDETDHFGNKDRTFTLNFHSRQVLSRIIRDPIIGFGEGYMRGEVEVEGDLRDLIKMAGEVRESFSKWREIQQRYFNWIKKVKPTSLSQQQKDIAAHYDLGNQFYSLWLDQTMTYSCAYFQHETDTLEQAQRNKNDYVLKKVMAEKGETVLDIGSGWGDLIILAAKKYGAKSVGITLSKEQLKKTKERISQEKLAGQVEVYYLDYRELPKLKKTFDKVVSVGMFEHVGEKNIPEFFKVIKTILKPQGITLLHTIGRIENVPVNPWLRKYIFPGGYIPNLQEILEQLANHHFQLIDIENLRLHYARTLDHWAANYDQHYDRVVKMSGETFARMWRLYLYGAAASFRYLGSQVYQILFTNGLRHDLPLTREHLYKSG